MKTKTGKLGNTTTNLTITNIFYDWVNTGFNLSDTGAGFGSLACFPLGTSETLLPGTNGFIVHGF